MIEFAPIVNDPASKLMLGELGAFAISRHYLTHRDEPERLYPLSLAQCLETGLVYLPEVVDVPELVPRFPWLTYREPTEHLEALAELVVSLPGITTAATISGLTWKDDPLLDYLSARGFTKIASVAGAFIGSNNTTAQFEFTAGRIPDAAVAQHSLLVGLSDVLIVRQGIEHAVDLPLLLRQLASMVKDNGYLVLEVPDCAAAFDAHEHAILWEDHVSYFTSVSVASVLQSLGFFLEKLQVYPYKFENSLVVVAKKSNVLGGVFQTRNSDRESEMRRAKEFYQQIKPRSVRYCEALRAYRDQGFELSVLGAGHHACFTLQLLGLGKLFHRCLDDDPHKQGLFLPGCRLPIAAVQGLPSGKRHCVVLGIGPDSEERALEKLRSHATGDLVIGSLFSRSKYSILDWVS